ncbi:MAG: hypothetical protein A2Y73_06820 [Chloroflexi bacterium RBG_13_56_8]|nr:MAG: hypothetical protein A2Y73_06820 [Chloroflexi bacterium RBG_13_56_8]
MNALRTFFSKYPRLASWAILSVGMGAILLFSAQGKGLTVGQVAWLCLACVGLAGACAWIIGWE